MKVTSILCLCLAVATYTSCHQKIVFNGNTTNTRFKLKGADGKVVNGILWIELPNQKFGMKYFTKTKLLTSNELLEVKSQIEKNITASKMLIRSIVSKEESGIGLYEADVYSRDETAISQEYKEADVENISNLMFPVLKFKDKIVVNTCMGCEVENIYAKEFQSQNSHLFDDEDMERIESYFKHGVRIYKGHLLNEESKE